MFLACYIKAIAPGQDLTTHANIVSHSLRKVTMRFIDVFSGCGGLSLGLVKAGWHGIFAVEKTSDAFASFYHNLILTDHFTWPSWLPCSPLDITTLHDEYKQDLLKLRGEVTLLAGGPPCQGFSYAGRRNPNDPRNMLSKYYLKMVDLLRPRFLLMENVQGFTKKFGTSKKPPQAEIVRSQLNKIGYSVYQHIIVSSDAGVPQPRRRFVLIGIKNGDPAEQILKGGSPFDLFYENLKSFRKKKGLATTGEISVRMAIEDLETTGKRLIPCKDSSISGFKQIEYIQPLNKSSYIELMREGMNEQAPDSLRLAKHTIEVQTRFSKILETCQPGKTITPADKERLSMKKHTLTPLAANKLAPTVTTLPDDIIHYSEPRILTVRETARLQSFPDWFSFKGAYTTGGKDRKLKCPRYTQVGNAVPPLLAEALGEVLLKLALE